MTVTENKDRIGVLLNNAHAALREAYQLSTNDRLTDEISTAQASVENIDEDDSADYDDEDFG